MKFKTGLTPIKAAGVICAFLYFSPSVLPQAGNGELLPTGWRIQPAGRQIPLDTFPMASALSRDGKFLLVLNGGRNEPSISVLAADSMQEVSKIAVADAWLGLCFSPDGSRVYVGGGSKYSVFEFSFSAGQLKPLRQINIALKAAP
jgi:hypothetical protein